MVTRVNPMATIHFYIGKKLTFQEENKCKLQKKSLFHLVCSTYFLQISQQILQAET